MIDETFVTEISDLAVRAAGVKIIPTPEPNGAYLIHDRAAGTFERRIPEPPPHEYAVASIDDMRRAFDHYAKQEGKTNHAVMAVGKKSIECHFRDGSDRLGKIGVPLSMTASFATLATWYDRKPAWLSQREMLLVLQVELNDATVVERTQFESTNAPAFPLDTLVESLSNLEFTTGKQTESNVKGKTDSISGSVKRECKGAAELPDYVTFRTPLYENFTEMYDVKTRLLVELEKEQIAFVPLGGQILRAYLNAQRDIVAEIERQLEGETVFIGETMEWKGPRRGPG